MSDDSATYIVRELELLMNSAPPKQRQILAQAVNVISNQQIKIECLEARAK